MRPQSDPDFDLEQAIDRELRRLPHRPAPSTLMPRVLEAIARRQALPWWQKSFAAWPYGARLTFLVLTTALSAVLIYFAVGLSGGLTLESLGAEARELGSRIGVFRSLGASLGGAGVALAKAAGPWFLWSLVAVAGASYLTTVALGTVCWRLATRRI